MAHFDFEGDWYGWRLRGSWLVTPDGQRITRERLNGLLWRDSMELRLAGFSTRRRAEANKRDRQRVKVVVVELADVVVNGQRAG